MDYLRKGRGRVHSLYCGPLEAMLVFSLRLVSLAADPKDLGKPVREYFQETLVK